MFNWQATDYRNILRDELITRTRANPAYTQNALARDIGLSPSRLSEILSGKQGLSTKKASDICHRLSFQNKKKDFFICLVEQKHARSKSQRLLASNRLKNFQQSSIIPLEQEYYQLISEWYHFPIIELTHMPHFQNDFFWISEKLGITIREAQSAVKRLIRLGFLTQENGTLKPGKDCFYTSPDNIPSESIQKSHHDILKKSQEAIYKQSINKRNYNSLIIGINKNDIPQAKKMIIHFAKTLQKFFDSSDTKEEVYCFSSQLFSLENE